MLENSSKVRRRSTPRGISPSANRPIADVTSGNMLHKLGEIVSVAQWYFHDKLQHYISV